LPDHVSFDSAALLEPLSVAIHAVNRAKPTPGSTALVMGAGTVGLLTAAMARQSGCTSIIIADVDQGRVDFAISKGFATHGYVVQRPLHASPSSSSIIDSSSCCSSGTSTPLDGVMPAKTLCFQAQLDYAKTQATEMLALLADVNPFYGSEDEDDGVDLAFECTGKEVCMHTSLYATRPGGKVVMVGMGTPIQTLPLSVAHLREIDIIGIFRYANTYATGIKLLSAAREQRKRATVGCAGYVLPDLDQMVTHRFKGLENADKAFELASRTSDNEGNLVLKVVIEQ
jgi:Threonine dehydrogenase and related Zn-dependent dehydrogenases